MYKGVSQPAASQHVAAGVGRIVAHLNGDAYQEYEPDDG